MDDSSAKKFQKDLNGGLVGLVLLAVLDQTDEDLYGYEIAKRLTLAEQSERTGWLRPAEVQASAGEQLALHWS